jgi:hypothetical protein
MTETLIVNVALARAQVHARLNDYASDVTAEARAARDVYEHARDTLLRGYIWSFARKRVELAQVVEVPAFGVDRAWALPSDFMRAISAHPSDSDFSRVRYKLETIEVSGADARVLVANSTQIYLRYVSRQISTSLMDPMFRDALAWELAKHFSLVIKESTAQAEYCGKELAKAISAARSTNALEDWPDRMPDGSWTEERYVEGDSWSGGCY